MSVSSGRGSWFQERTRPASCCRPALDGRSERQLVGFWPNGSLAFDFLGRAIVPKWGPGANGRAIFLILERETGFEPATSTLARSHSTAELLPLSTKHSKHLLPRPERDRLAELPARVRVPAR